MPLHREYRDFLEEELKELGKELIYLLELPDAGKLRSRIKKDRRDIQAMLDLYKRITDCNASIRTVKVDIREIIKEIQRQLGVDKVSRSVKVKAGR